MTDAAEALRAGEPVILPTDTVYGLCGAYSSGPTERLYAIKGRDPLQPSALLAADLETLFECVPELRGRAARSRRPSCPGRTRSSSRTRPGAYRWITGSTPDAIERVRVPDLPADAERVITHVGCIVATSANLAGGPDPRRVDEVAPELLALVGANRRRRAAGHAFDGARLHRQRAPRHPRRRRARGRGARAGRACTRVKIQRAESRRRAVARRGLPRRPPSLRPVFPAASLARTSSRGPRAPRGPPGKCIRRGVHHRRRQRRRPRSVTLPMPTASAAGRGDDPAGRSRSRRSGAVRSGHDAAVPACAARPLRRGSPASDDFGGAIRVVAAPTATRRARSRRSRGRP